jgi:hypothetical protein
MPEPDLELTLPILVGLHGERRLTAAEAEDLLHFLQEQFRPFRTRYPDCPIILVADVMGDLRAVANRLPAALGDSFVKVRDLGELGARGDAGGSSQNSLGALDGGAIVHALDPRPSEASWFLARTCHLLIVVTRPEGADELEASKLIHLRLNSGARSRPSSGIPTFDLDPSDGLECLHVVLGTGADGRTFRVDRVVPRNVSDLSSGEKNRLQSLLGRTAHYNKDVTRATGDFSSDVAQSIKHLAPPEIAHSNPHLLAIQSAYGAADALALRYQERVHAAFLAIFVLAVTATAFFGWFLVIAKDIGVLATYFSLLLAAYLVFLVARRANTHARYVDYRALAEGIRVKFFWSACTVKQNVSDHFLTEERNEMGWIRHAIDWIGSGIPAGRGMSDGVPIPIDEIVRHWISGQSAYFRQAFESAGRIARRSRVIAGAIFLIGVGSTCIVVVSPSLEVLAGLHLTAFSFMSVLCPAISAAIVGLANKMGYTYRERHYARMLAIYSRADTLLSENGSGHAKAVALVLGEEALRENANWASFRRERTIDAPASPFKKPW